MRNYLFLFISFILLSCSNKHDSTVEMSFTSRNNDTFTELKSLYLTNIDASKRQETKNQSFQNLKSTAPNKFVLKEVNPGLYLGLIQIVNKYGTYNITWDSILITPGKNYLTKEITLGGVKL